MNEHDYHYSLIVMFFRKRSQANNVGDDSIVKLKRMIVFLALILLIGCVPEKEIEEKLLSTGIQYLGNQEKMLTKLDSLQIEYKNPTTVDIELEEYKLVIAEPNYIEEISGDTLQQALNKGLYVFFINIEDSRLIQEKYFNTIVEEENTDKIWVEHLYLKEGKLRSVVFSTGPDFEEELFKWLQYFDQYKEESN